MAVAHHSTLVDFGIFHFYSMQPTSPLPNRVTPLGAVGVIMGCWWITIRMALQLSPVIVRIQRYHEGQRLGFFIHKRQWSPYCHDVFSVFVVIAVEMDLSERSQCFTFAAERPGLVQGFRSSRGKWILTRSRSIAKVLVLRDILIHPLKRQISAAKASLRHCSLLSWIPVACTPSPFFPLFYNTVLNCERYLSFRFQNPFLQR